MNGGFIRLLCVLLAVLSVVAMLGIVYLEAQGRTAPPSLAMAIGACVGALVTIITLLTNPPRNDGPR